MSYIKKISRKLYHFSMFGCNRKNKLKNREFLLLWFIWCEIKLFYEKKLIENNLKHKSWVLHWPKIFFFDPFFFYITKYRKTWKIIFIVVHQNNNFLNPNIASSLGFSTLIVQLRHEGKENFKFELYINTM